MGGGGRGKKRRHKYQLIFLRSSFKLINFSSVSLFISLRTYLSFCLHFVSLFLLPFIYNLITLSSFLRIYVSLVPSSPNLKFPFSLSLPLPPQLLIHIIHIHYHSKSLFLSLSLSLFDSHHVHTPCHSFSLYISLPET